MKVQELLHGLAVAAHSIGQSSTDPKVKVSAEGAAVLLSLLERVVEGRTVEEAKQVLHSLLLDGVKPISSQELDDQARKITESLKRE